MRWDDDNPGHRHSGGDPVCGKDRYRRKVMREQNAIFARGDREDDVILLLKGVGLLDAE